MFRESRFQLHDAATQGIYAGVSQLLVLAGWKDLPKLPMVGSILHDDDSRLSKQWKHRAAEIGRPDFERWSVRVLLQQLRLVRFIGQVRQSKLKQLQRLGSLDRFESGQMSHARK